ncbi:MAG: DMT family transporter [Planctomycetes bacterium]|nr:DMT family transporter [Planctomycetota bacterium]
MQPAPTVEPSGKRRLGSNTVALVRRHLASDYFPIAMCLFLWAMVTPVLKYVQEHRCDEYNAVFYRTTFTALALTFWVFRYHRAQLREVLRFPVRLILLGLFYLVGVLAFVAGTFLTSATLAILITRAVPLFAIVFSVFCFVDERRLVRRPGFVIGFLLATLGLSGLCLTKDSGQVEWSFGQGAGLLLLCAFLWALYSLGVKAWLAKVQPTVASMIIFWVASLGSLPALLIWGDSRWILNAEPMPIAVLVITGPLIMGLGESLYFVSVRRIGLASSTSATLLVPLITAVMAWPTLGERPTVALAGFGALMLAGLALIVRTRSGHVKLEKGGVPEPLVGRQGTAAAVMGRIEAPPEEPVA